ncbi:TSUP family transporter [Propionimicrobium lymphophilum]|uniref:TSUP family transporter n=1 Tax=Propionimicrobium lymphophilum TaxID=33012 RepID=UPI00040C947C|nr:TSUP family transporter [Propionimicrobium lymphophilum]
MESLADISTVSWVVLILAAAFTGLAKTAQPGLATVSVALFAAVLPARESTAVLLLPLLLDDLMAVWICVKTVDWRRLPKLVPWVLIGVVAGAAFLTWSDNKIMRVAIGIIC